MLLPTTSLVQSRLFVKTILPKVSRTFALNIKVLSGKDYDFIACAYLICRFIDTIEDSPHTKSEEKIKYLNLFHRIFKKSSNPDDFIELIKGTVPMSANLNEEQLVEKFHWVMKVYYALDKRYLAIGLEPILEMAHGMRDFIKKYANKDEVILKDESEMEKYCYYVAGTVGKLLTGLFTSQIKSGQIRSILKSKMLDFGLGLQMTNIAKDFQRDGVRGWTYIPQSYLKDEGLTLSEFLSGDFPDKTKKIHLRFIDKAMVHLDKSLVYTCIIPKNRIKYRLFCFIPLFLATRTISFIRKQAADDTFKDKISKKYVYFIIFLSYLASVSNLLSKKSYLLLKK